MSLIPTNRSGRGCKMPASLPLSGCRRTSARAADDAFSESLMEIIVFARLHARPGKQSEVHQAMFEVQGPTRQEPGCLSYGGFRSVRDPDAGAKCEA
jgi:hypothetical protein